MKKRRFHSSLSLLLAAAMVIGSLSIAKPVEAAEGADAKVQTGTTYYVDSKDGNDNNDGTSPEQAWQNLTKVTEENLQLGAGDKLLLKAGSTWNGQKLFIHDASGDEGNPVIIGKYGEGENPIINGNGNPWNDEIEISDLKKEDVAVVHIQNSEYITIQDLHVTNWESDEDDLMSDTASYTFENKQSKSMLTGILVENNDAGQLDGVVIQNNHVENVNGWMSVNNESGDKKGSGGIMVLVTGGERKSYFNDLKILGNEVNKVCHEAIYMESCWAVRKLVGSAGSQQAGSLGWVGWKDVYVADNYVHNVAGDGIVVINADGAVAEHNLVIKSAEETWYYGRNPAHAAIWMWDSNNVTMQYNEAAYTESTQDGMAFDSDYGNQNILYQYNYSHDNKGGFWMACPGPYYSLNSVIRYNVSVNDAGFDGGRIIHVGESGSIGHQVYNNTIYWDADYEVKAVEQGGWTNGLDGTTSTAVTSGTDIYNNIFYGSSASFVDNAGTTYNNNCVWGDVKDNYLESVNDPNAIIADPQFTDITKAYTTGTFDNTKETGKVTIGNADGLKLKAESPCIDMGVNYMNVPQESLEKVADETVRTHIKLEYKDYEGNPVQKGSVDIGAYEYQGDKAPVTQASDTSYLQALVKKADTYKENQFVSASWKKFTPVLAAAKGILNRDNLSQELLDSYTTRMEEAMLALETPDMPTISGGEAGSDIIAGFNSSDTIDNSGFEKSAVSWTTWQNDISESWVDALAVMAVSGEQHHGGSKSLELKRGEGTGTVYADLSDVPVEAGTKYICEAWFHCGSNEASAITLEIKEDDDHYERVNAGQAAATEGDWKKVTAEYTPVGTKLTISFHNAGGSAAYLDDLTLRKAGNSVYDTHYLDTERNALKQVIADSAPLAEEKEYTSGSWKNYQNVLMDARVECVNALATAQSLKDTETKLQAAKGALRGNDTVLKAAYEQYKNIQQGSSTSTSWSAFQTALNNAKNVLESPNATQTQIKTALEQLTKAKAELVTAVVTKAEQVISVTTASYTKKVGDAPFSLRVKITTGNGSLKFQSSDTKVAEVSNKGKVTLKGAGVCTVTVTAAGTSTYNEKTAQVTIKVGPKKAKLKSLKAAKGKKLTVKWTKDNAASGYEIQYSLKSNFKSAKKVTVAKASASSTVIKKGLKPGKKYYVRVRAYKNVKVGDKTEKLVGTWSDPKASAKIKK